MSGLRRRTCCIFLILAEKEKNSKHELRGNELLKRRALYCEQI